MHIAYYQEHGITHETTAPHTPQQNGDAEHLNRTLTDKVRVMFQSSGLSKSLWPDTFKWASYTQQKPDSTSHEYDTIQGILRQKTRHHPVSCIWQVSHGAGA